MVNENIEADRFLVPVIKRADGVFVLEHIQRFGDGEVRCAASVDIIRAVHIRVRLLECASPQFRKLCSPRGVDSNYLIRHISV